MHRLFQIGPESSEGAKNRAEDTAPAPVSATAGAASAALRGVVARLIRGARPRPSGTGEAPRVPDLSGVQRRRILSRPAGVEAPAADAGSAAIFRSVRPAIRQRTPRRRRGLSFAVGVLLPLGLLSVYMLGFAAPQYASTVAFTVRSADPGAVTDALTGFAELAGAGRSADTMILAEYFESQTLLERLDGRLDLVRHYAAPFGHDPLFALAPGATIEGRLTHWRHMLRVTSDPSTGLIGIEVHAFSPEMAQLVARELLVEGGTLLNDLNADMRRAATLQAQAELAATQDRLIAARAALTTFRTESRILDAAGDAETRASVLRMLHGELAEALADGVGAAETPRVAALRDMIDAERDRLVREPVLLGLDYPQVLATHERLAAERDYAVAAHLAARRALDLTQAQAARRDLHLAVYIQPTLPERADRLRTARILGLAALFLSLTWAIGAIARAAVLDRR